MNKSFIENCLNCENGIKCYECYILSGDEERDRKAYEYQQKINEAYNNCAALKNEIAKAKAAYDSTLEYLNKLCNISGLSAEVVTCTRCESRCSIPTSNLCDLCEEKTWTLAYTSI